MKHSSPRSPWWISEQLIRNARAYRRYRARPGLIAVVLRKIARVKHNVLSVLTASDIDPNAELGEGLKLPHPNGVVIHPDVRIGRNCMIMQQVTLGQRSVQAAPVLGDGVYVGAGAKLLGAIFIGDGAAIGANAVVLQDVPAGCTAVGVPARIKAKLELVGEGMDLLAPDGPPPPARFDGSSQNRAR